MNAAIVLAILIFAPAVLALAFAGYSMVRFILSRRGASMKNQLAVGALGMFAIFAPKLLTSESKKHFTRFIMSASFFCLYSAVLVLVANVL